MADGSRGHFYLNVKDGKGDGSELSKDRLDGWSVVRFRDDT